MRALISIICLSLCPFLTHAAEDPDVSGRLNAYFDAGIENTRQITLIANLPVTPKVILFILKTVRKRLQSNLASLETWAQADDLMIVLRQMLEETPSLATAEPEVKSALVQEANTLLYSYVQPSRSQNGLLAVFDRLGLWNPENLWFFVRSGAENETLHHHPYRILSLIPQLNPGPRRQLAAYLHQPAVLDGLVASCLLYKLERYTIADLVVLFRHASLRFARSVSRISRLPPANQVNPVWTNPDNLVIAQTMKDLQLALAQSEPMVTTAFAEAVRETRSQTPVGYDQEYRIQFFEMFQDQSLDWLDREQWLHRQAAKANGDRKVSLQSRYRSLIGNIIKIGFPKSRICVTALERPKKN